MCKQNDDLVKRLRNRRVCIQQSGSLEDFPLLTEAADTITELSDFRERMDHICAIQYMWRNGPYMMGEMVAYFDDRKITEDEVREAVYSGSYDPRIVSMYRTQAEQVFGYRWLDDSNKETENYIGNKNRQHLLPKQDWFPPRF